MQAKHRVFDGSVDEIRVSQGLVVVPNRSDGGSTDSRGKRTGKSLRQTKRQQVSSTGSSELNPVLARATAVVGSKEEAMRWLGTPVRALGYATPISLLVDKNGADEVLALLDNLEHGVL